MAVVLWTRGDDFLWLGVLAWAWVSAAFFRWFDQRSRGPADASAPRWPLGIEIPVALQSPPPRATRSEFAARAARHYRTAYPGLFLLRNKVAVRFSFEEAPRRVLVPLDEVRDLGPELQVPVPILVKRGSDLVGMVTAREKIVVARVAR